MQNVDDDEDFGAGTDELNRWYSRSPDDIEQERRDAEQAGREAYADAIRTGADVQARTPAELVALGRARLAQQAGHAPGSAQSGLQGLGEDGPLVNPDDNSQVAGPPVAKSYPNSLDPIVEREVANYNQMNQADPGDDIYLDPDLIKAQIRVESGYDQKTYNSDPMQVNKSGDWDADPKTGDPGHKVTLGLQHGVPPGPELGIRAGLGWLDAKSYIHDGSGQLGPFIGWERTFKRYNGGRDPQYWEKIQNAYRDIKSGGR
jgi:hypothetical protein